MADKSQSTFKFFHYDPSLAAAIIFIVLFSSTTVMHGYQLFRNRTWLMIPFFIGGCFEFIGYIARAVSSQQSPDWTLGPYIVTAILVLVAPALLAASIYMLLGRIILVTDGEPHSLIKRRWLTKIFVGGDVLSFFMQSSGGGMMARKTASAIDMGKYTVVGGLVVQIIFFGFFMIVAIVFNTRLSKKPTSSSMSGEVPWQQHLYILYGASTLIMIRSIFRVVEYLQGNDGYLLGHEAFLYIFDATLMLGAMLLFNVVHPKEISELVRRRYTAHEDSELASSVNIQESKKGSPIHY